MAHTMSKAWLVSAFAASALTAVVLPPAQAQDRGPERGAKPSTERDESEADSRARMGRTQIFILRGMQPSAQTVEGVEPPPPEKSEPRKMKTIHRGHRTFKVPAD